MNAKYTQRLYRGLAILIATLPFMDLEVFQLLGRSFVLPYVATGFLALVVLGSRGVLAAQLRNDHALPFLLWWFVLAVASSSLFYYRDQREDVLASNLAQLASIGLMIAHYVFISAALRAQPFASVERLVNLIIFVAAAGGALSLYQLAHVAYGWPYAEWWRTSNLYFKANTLNWHGGGSWIALPRPYGTAPEPTFWSGYMVTALAVLLGQFSARWTRWHVVSGVLIAAGLVLTFARAVLPPSVLLLVVWMLYLFRRTFPAAVTVAVVVASVALTVWPAFVSDSSLTLWRDHSAIERLSAQVTGLRMGADHPFIGSGPGSVPFLVDQYLFVIEGRQQVAFSRLYSFLLVVFVATGLIGLIVFAAFLVELVRPLHRAIGRPDPAAALSLSAVLAFVAIVVNWVGSAAYNMSYIWFCLALAGAIPRREPIPTDE